METYPTWIRLHPDAFDETLAVSVQARMHDPLWLLGRQWQLGELRHDAGATPIDVRLEGTSSPLARLRAGVNPDPSAPFVTINPRGVPLEAQVERDAVPEERGEGLRLRMEAGLQLVRMLRAANLGTEAAAWTARCAFARPAEELDAETASWWELVDGRVPDGARLRPAVASALNSGGAPSLIGAEEGHVLRAWLAWHGVRFQTPRGRATWDPERFEYAFTVGGLGATAEAVLAAPEYVEGRLDWFAFEQTTGGFGLTGQPTTKRHYRIPAPLDFAGMPNPRFWTFEDPSVRFDTFDVLANPSVEPSPATLLVLDFALSYGDDWFLVPLTIDAWTIFEMTELAVSDVFGDVTIAQHPDGRWNLFRLDTAGESGDLSRLYVCAVPVEAGEGPAIEELHLLRDEIANVAWAVERIVPHPLGHGREIPPPAAYAPTDQQAGLTWTLAPSSPPRNWFPLVPTIIGRLTPGVLWSARDARPVGRLLTELRTSRGMLHQEEVPSEGVQVARRWQSARGLDGSLHFWVGRNKSPRREFTAPAIRFDIVSSS